MTPVLSIVDGKKYHQVIENAAAQDKIVVIKIGASFCRELARCWSPVPARGEDLDVA
jgi:hypothetical protein